MTHKDDFDLFVAGKTGSFKGVKVDSNGILVKNLQHVNILKQSDEISVLRWDDVDECNILIGTVDQHVKIYDTECKTFVTCTEAKFGTGSIVGLSRFNSDILTCSESGHVKLWKSNENEQMDFQVGGLVNCMKCVSHNNGIIATGGKQNDLKLWDVETKKKIFNAKNVKKDMLELEVPIWVSDIQYIPNTEHQLVVSTKYGQVRLYDTKAQRRPVLDVQLTNQSLNTLSLCDNFNRIITGSTTGYMLSVDIRGKGKVLHTYKGAVGSIRQIVSNPDKPYIASVGLDRYLRIHHLETRKLLHQQYLKVRLNAALMRRSFGDVQLKEPENKAEESDVICNELKEYNDMFDNMETVGEENEPSKRKRRKLK